FDPRRVIWFGGQSVGETRRQFEALREDRRYQAVLLLTDETSMDMARDGAISGSAGSASPGGPLYLVHLGGALAAGYDDATLAAIQASGGGVATSVEEVFASFASTARPGFLAEGGGYRFTLE